MPDNAQAITYADAMALAGPRPNNHFAACACTACMIHDERVQGIIIGWNTRAALTRPEPDGDLRERIARIIAAGNYSDPWWWKEAFDEGADETAVQLRCDDVAIADAILAALSPPAQGEGGL